MARGDRNWWSRYPWAPWISATWNPASRARAAAALNSETTRRSPASSRARGAGQPSSKGRALGASPGQEAGGTLFPFQGAPEPALRPAWASWIPGTAPWALMNAAMRARGPIWPSSQMPRSSALMRPSGATEAASVRTSPAPPWARPPRCTRCQSLARPSTALYWHMGETAMRLGRVTPRREKGENNRFMGPPFIRL